MEVGNWGVGGRGWETLKMCLQYQRPSTWNSHCCIIVLYSTQCAANEYRKGLFIFLKFSGLLLCPVS
jgi:hypothetical protein